MSDVRLREVTEADLPIFYAQQLDPDATRMAAFPARGEQAHLAHWQRILADETLVARTILHDDRVAGNIGSWTQDGQRLVGYWLGKEFWGRGIASRALGAFLDVVRERPLYAHVAAHNVASRRVLEKCGFMPVGEAEAAAAAFDDGIEEVVFVLR